MQPEQRELVLIRLYSRRFWVYQVLGRIEYFHSLDTYCASGALLDL